MISLKNSSKIRLLGKEYEVVYSNKKLLKPRTNIEDSFIYVFQSEIEKVRHKVILEEYLRERAKKEIVKRTRTLAVRHGFKVNRVSVRDQSSRWGSCSSAKNINLNWRLVFAPTGVMDYVIIHELCHTKQMNHSKKFWDLVAETMPTWKTHRKWLRENGNELEMARYS